jgi:hypothetical protein
MDRDDIDSAFLDGDLTRQTDGATIGAMEFRVEVRHVRRGTPRVVTMRIGQAIVAVVKIPILVGLLVAGCSGRALEPGAGDDMGSVNASDLARVDSRDAAGACALPSTEETAAAVKVAWVALDAPGPAPRVEWSCACIERTGIWCDLYRDGDPMTVTWFARLDGERVIHPARISESLLGYVLAVYADSLGAKMEPTVWDAGERARQVLAAEGF